MATSLGRIALSLVVLVILAIALPRLYDLVFGVDVSRTHLFYSPVDKTFVFREHHGNHDFVYADEGGKTFDRKTFETKIPFIYYKNMDIWGLLPLTIDGKTYDRKAMRDSRHVLELKPRELADRKPEIPVYPLIESNPGRARLTFPEDVFRMTDTGMEFVNVDTNEVDPDLTARYTSALVSAGAQFPIRLVAGKATILKPFDEGYFLVDAAGAVFHMKRIDGVPSVIRTPIPADLDIRHIKVSENARRLHYGLVLAGDGRIFLLSYDNYRLIPLPSKGYDPDRMNYKLILNPVNPTAIFDDDRTITAVAMAPDFAPVARHERPVPGTRHMVHARIARVLFPFTIDLKADGSGYLEWRLKLSSWSGLIGIALALTVVLGFLVRRGQSPRQAWPELLLVTIGGIYGLVALIALPPRRRPGGETPENTITVGSVPLLSDQPD